MKFEKQLFNEIVERHTFISETIVCFDGTCIDRYYDNEGNETAAFTLSARHDLIGLQIPAGQFHSLEVPADWKDKAVTIKFKSAKFEPNRKEDALFI